MKGSKTERGEGGNAQGMRMRMSQLKELVMSGSKAVAVAQPMR
jgi:hypothetical protein